MPTDILNIAAYENFIRHLLKFPFAGQVQPDARNAFFFIDEHNGYLSVALGIMAILLVTFITTKILRKTLRTLGKNTIYQKFIKNVLSVVIWIIGIGFSLSLIPHFSDIATALITGSGIAALTIGLAAQESLGNAFNGLFISVSKPFEVGDRIHLINANITGFVEDITVRHTVIRTFMNSRIIIPNSVMSKELIENSNFFNPQASSFIDVTVTYSSDINQACEIIAQIIGDHPEFVDTRTPEKKETTPKVPVFIRSLGLYGVELRASMWTACVDVNFASCSDVRKAILCEFEKASIHIASSKFIDPMANA